MIGETVGSYRITSKLSTGGMGTVYKAEHALIGKLAAVKVLHPELCHNREIVGRFFNEAKATTQIKHPGIVEIFDFGYMESGDAFIVMEFLEGMSMARRLKHKGRMDTGEAAMLLRGVCNALAAAHAKKIIHRDLKPDNIYLCPDGEAPTGERAKILDFGIAKLTDNLSGPTTVTQTGAVMGTPTYMSPEQCRGNGEVDERADLYSIGCIFYELLTGQPPFVNMAAGELIGAHLFMPIAPPRTLDPNLAQDADALTMQLLEKDPGKRPQSARELGLRFAEIAKNHGWISHTNPTAMRAPEASGVMHATEDEVFDATLASPPGLSAPSGLTPPVSMKPTTLSGAASQSVVDVPRRRVGLIAGVAAAVAVVSAVSFVVVRGGGSKDVAPATAPAAPAASIAAPAPTPTPAAVPAAAPVAAPAPAPAPVAAPAPAAVAAPAPAAVATPTPAHVAAPPVTKPVVKKPPTTAIKPAVKPAKPADTHKPGAGSGKILIETDL